MIKVVAKHVIKDDKTNDFIAALKPLMEETNQNHRGCISYELFQDMDNPSIMTIIEEWENQSCLEEHMGTEIFKETIGSSKVYLEGPVVINKYKKVL